MFKTNRLNLKKKSKSASPTESNRYKSGDIKTGRKKGIEPILNFQVPTEGLELVIFYTYT